MGMRAPPLCLRMFPSVLLLFLLVCAGCSDGDLRGYTEPSTDRQTYLVVEALAGSDCSLIVDGNPWPYPIGAKGLIQPGKHTIECYGEIEFIIDEGVIFHFDYWGP